MDWLLATIFFFLIVISPWRSWTIEADTTESEDPKVWNEFKNKLANFLPSWMRSAYKKVYKILPAGLLVGVLVFAVYYKFVDKLEEALRSVSHLSFPFVTSSIASLLPFVFCIRDFKKLRLVTLFVMSVFVVTIRHFCNMDFLIFFVTSFVFQLHLTYGRSYPWQRWFFRVFVAVFCPKAMSHFFGITSLFSLLFLAIVTGILYTFTDLWIHHDTKDAVIIREKEKVQVRYFQRGVAKTQMKFVKQRLKVFIFAIGVTIFCALGHVHPWTTFEYGPEIMANVFCKVDTTRQLECRVKTAYNDPYSEAENCTSVSQDWDYCGA